MKKRLIATLLAAGLLAGAASAQTVTFALDDSGVDYVAMTTSDTSNEIGHASIGSGEAGPVLVLSHSRLDGSLPPIGLVVPALGSDRRGGSRLADVHDLEPVELEPWGAEYAGFTLYHPTASLAEVIEAYADAFRDLGFGIATERAGRNQVVQTLSSDEGTLRAVFTVTGDGVRAHVSRG